MLKISHLHKTFNTGKVNQVIALHDVNIEIQKSEFVVIVGANGSGKSTLLNCISGSIFPDSGSIHIGNCAVDHLREHQRSKWIARVFQNPLSGTAPDLSILENFRLAALRTSSKGLRIGITERFKNTVKDRIAELGMGLEAKVHQPMGSLSGGQRQALTLLMAVMDGLEILLLDEPTAALDPRSAETIMKTAAKLIANHQLTAVLITHNMKEALAYGSRIIQMAEGQVRRDVTGAQKTGLTPSNLYEWFL
ncbi:ABC transporter ATP-binding protein [Paradesertivirga mongoliensis]|uniref:ABC transporter ATP-binding protein n=1 Tax=Paradesertivirga mongoliensis TaxID=2100740 RepID=A0ABW4ZNH2_9SPHI|nr:ATP-binding cassette domain-containing protein [Pedobacter mongoliensis]